MKNKFLSKLYFSLFLILCFVTSGCNNIFSEKGKSDNSKVKVSLVLAFSSAQKARTANADSALASLTNIQLRGSLNGVSSKSLATWDSYADITELSIESGLWDFTLVATLNGVNFSATVTGKAISSGDEVELAFELSTTYQYGGIDVSLNYSEETPSYVEAQLYDIENDSPLGSASSLDLSTAGSVQYVKDISDTLNPLNPGSYRLKIFFYGDATKSILLTRYSCIVNVVSGFVSKASQTIKLNALYSITFDLDEGSFAAGAIVPEYYSVFSDAISLPELTKEDYAFDGWYEDEDFSGDKVTEIAAGSSGNKTLYAHFITKFAKVGETLYTNLSDTLTAITDASGEITIELYSSVTENDIGIPEGTSYAPDIEGTIAYAIKNTSASAVNLVVAEDAAISVSDLSYLFKGCSKLKTADLRGIDTSSATSLFGLFYNCSALTSFDISTFDFSNITNIAFMFNGCSSLTEIDCSNFDTSKCTNMHGMFYGCTNLTNLNVSSFDTGKASSFVNMFTNCSSLVSLDISSFTTTYVHNGETKIKAVAFMFTGCSSLVYINVASTFDFSSLEMESGDNMFSGCTALLGDNGTSYDPEKIQAEYARPDGGTDSPGYFWTYRIGYKNRPTEVGDIVFNDGSALPYTDGMTFTEAQKEAAIAVIFYKGRDLVEDGVISGQDFELGVGLVQSSNLPWCTEDAKGYSTNFEGMHCTISGSAGNYTIEGDRSGRNNTMVMEGALGSNNDTGTSGNYPAFDFVNNYKDQPGSHLTSVSVYTTGWYLPSIAEMYTIYQNREMVNGALAALGGTQFNSTADNCWSSNQCPDSATAVYGFNFSNGEIGTFSKNNNRNGVEYACAIFQF